MTEPKPKRTRAPRAAAAAAAPDSEALTQAMRELLAPLARLSVARGVPFATIDEMLKSAFVEAARAAHPELPGHRAVSRISTATGLNRREVARLTRTRSEPAPIKRSPAARLLTTWLTEPALKTRRGEVMALPRQGPAPSFEALAHSITRDVHPRSLLDELCRLGMAQLEGDGDTVRLLHDSFVPQGDAERMLRLLGHNVGDHLQAAVTNVLSDTAPHLEQAIFTDELSQASMDEVRQLMRTQWKALLETTVPALQRMIDADRAAGRTADQRLRVGLYTYHEAVAAPSAPATPTAPEPEATSKRKRP